MSTCDKCGATYLETQPDGSRYWHTCPPPREAEPPRKVIPMPAPTLPERWAHVRAMLTRILDWIEGRL